jgi:hypothetical protein
MNGALCQGKSGLGTARGEQQEGLDISQEQQEGTPRGSAQNISQWLLVPTARSPGFRLSPSRVHPAYGMGEEGEGAAIVSRELIDAERMQVFAGCFMPVA